MTIDITEDLETRLKRFPQIMERLPDLLAEQIALEEWRERRYSAEAHEIVNEVLDSPASPERDFSRLEKAFVPIAEQLKSGE